MAGSVNKVILVGNLGRDPEVRSTQSGSRVANFTVATSERWRDRQTNEPRERTEWHRVVIWNENLVDVAEKYLRKGRQVYLEGELQTRKWTDQSGQERYMTEVVLQRFRGQLQMLGRRDEDGDGGGGGFAGEGGGDYDRAEPPGGGDSRPQPAAVGGGGGADFDDDIPF